MWQEARKQEKKLRGIMIDFKKRAERRHAYYAKMVINIYRIFFPNTFDHYLSRSYVTLRDVS